MQQFCLLAHYTYNRLDKRTVLSQTEMSEHTPSENMQIADMSKVQSN